MFSMLNTPPSPYSNTLASAGTNCVVVTSTLTDVDLEDKRENSFRDGSSKESEVIHSILAQFAWL